MVKINEISIESLPQNVILIKAGHIQREILKVVVISRLEQ